MAARPIPQYPSLTTDRLAAREWWNTRWFIAAALFLSVLPLLWPAIPPLIDLPSHMGAYHVAPGEQWHFSMKARIGVDADSGLVHTVTTTAAHESDVE